MERQAQVSINPTKAAVDRADQNTTCSLPPPGQSVPTQQDKLEHTSCVLHISKFQPETAASLGCPSLRCPPASSCQPGFATFTPQTEHALFAVNTINRCTELGIHESHLCHAGRRRSLPQQSRAVRKDRRPQEGAVVSSS